MLPRGTLHITRSRFIWDGVCHEMIRVRNFALSTVSVELVVRFGSDFENIVDVRAQRRVDAAARASSAWSATASRRAASGADEIMRETVVDCHTAPDAISADSLRYRLQIGSRGEKTISLAIGCRSANQPVQISTFTRSLAAAEERARSEGRPTCQVQSSDAPFNAWMHRAAADIGMMLTATPQGRVPAAGLPWLDAHLRPRRDHHGAADAVAVAGYRAQRAALPRRHAMHRQLRRATAPRPARYSTRRAAATSRLTTTASTPRRCS